MNEVVGLIKQLMWDAVLFAQYASGLRLRKYQEEVARAILDSVIKGRGMTFVVIFPRQSGKNELQAQIEAYLLTLTCSLDVELVKVSPTWKPQSLNAMRRLERVLKRNLIARELWKKESGYIYRVGRARMFFLSGSPTTNIVGATASALLECDEAQDVLISKWDKDIAPMAASTNATRVFWGTAWTSKTLLAREMRAAREEERLDGRTRVFVLTAEEVGAEVPAYRKFVEGEVRKHGRQHPFIKTQFFSEEIDSEGGMFPVRRLALMRGDHPRQREALPGRIYALLLDVAGEDEGAVSGLAGSFDFAQDAPRSAQDASQALSREDLANPKRDSTALTVVEVDLSALGDELVGAPIYRVVDRRLWTGVKHTLLLQQLQNLARVWDARYVVVDATGVGAGLASFLERAMPDRLIPFVFSQSSKSTLGWNFLSVIESGRYRDYAVEPGGRDQDQEAFWIQLEHCQMEAIPGPERRLRWGVPEGTRDPKSGELVHDDLILSAALCAVLDRQVWGTAESEVVKAVDPLEGMGEVW